MKDDDIKKIQLAAVELIKKMFIVSDDLKSKQCTMFLRNEQCFSDDDHQFALEITLCRTSKSPDNDTVH